MTQLTTRAKIVDVRIEVQFPSITGKCQQHEVTILGYDNLKGYSTKKEKK